MTDCSVFKHHLTAEGGQAPRRRQAGGAISARADTPESVPRQRPIASTLNAAPSRDRLVRSPRPQGDLRRHKRLVQKIQQAFDGVDPDRFRSTMPTKYASTAKSRQPAGCVCRVATGPSAGGSAPHRLTVMTALPCSASRKIQNSTPPPGVKLADHPDLTTLAGGDSNTGRRTSISKGHSIHPRPPAVMLLESGGPLLLSRRRHNTSFLHACTAARLLAPACEVPPIWERSLC